MMLSDPKQNPSPEWIEALRKRYPTHEYVDETLTRKLLRRSDPPHSPQPLDQVKSNLEAFLRKRIGHDFSISAIRGLAGGSSKEQYKFSVERITERGEKDIKDYVLRMRPAESVVETHALREFQALNAAYGQIPVPKAHWVDASGDELGQPALITDFCQGVTTPPYEGAYNPRRGIPEAYRAKLAPQFTEYFARLAKLDWTESDMSAFDQPRAGTNEGVISSINWWERVWEEDSAEAYPLMTLAAHWLRENAPPIDHVSIVHTDFRLGNFLFDLEGAEITSILDWELSHLGDRHEDLAFFLNPMFTSQDEQGNLLVGRLLPLEDFIDRYETASGLPVDQERLDYYMLFNAWRGTVNALATATRCMIGQKTHQDIRVGWIAYTSALNLKLIHEELTKRI